MNVLSRSSQGSPGQLSQLGKARDGMSWEGQSMPPSAFQTVVAPPTIQIAGSEGYGAIPTVEEFRNAMGRDPDKYERSQMEGLRPFNDSTGYELYDFKTGKSVQTVMHLSISPEKRRDVLLRLPMEDRGGYLAIWTLLDYDQQVELDEARRLLEEDDTLRAIEELRITDARLAAVGSYGVIQDGMVKVGRSHDKPLEGGVPVTEFFSAVKQAQPAKEEKAQEPEEKKACVVQEVENTEGDELKKPVQSLEIRYKIAGSTMKRKCAYVKVNEAARAMLVAYAAGADSDEFDEGTDVSVTVNGRTCRCEAGPVFEIDEAAVTCQIFKIKE